MYLRRCPVCDHDRWTILVPAVGTYSRASPFEYCNAQVVICRRCGLPYVNPLPTPEETFSHTRKMSEEAAPYREPPTPGECCGKQIDLLRSLLGEKKPSRALFAGPFSGSLLGLFEEAYPGCEIYGVDPDIQRLRYTRTTYGLPFLYCASFEQTRFPDGFFDTVFLATLHHAHDVRGALETLERITRPGAPVFLELWRRLFNGIPQDAPGHVPDLEDWLLLNPSVTCWFHDEHLRTLLAGRFLEIVENGSYTVDSVNGAQVPYWYFLRRTGTKQTPRAPDAPAREVGFERVLHYFLAYSETTTVQDLRRFGVGPDMRIGLLGGAPENRALAEILLRHFPGVRLWQADLDLTAWRKRETAGRNESKPEARRSLPEIVCATGHVDVILLTSFANEEELVHLRACLGPEAHKLRPCIFKHRHAHLPGEIVLHRNRDLDRDVLIKAFLPAFIESFR